MSTPGGAPHNSHRKPDAALADLEAGHVRAQAAELAAELAAMHAAYECYRPPEETCPSCQLDARIRAFLEGLAQL